MVITVFIPTIALIPPNTARDSPVPTSHILALPTNLRPETVRRELLEQVAVA